MAPNEAMTLDPQHRILLEETYLGLADARADPTAQPTGEDSLAAPISWDLLEDGPLG